MGAAAAKQLQPDKTKHAAIVMEAVRGYEEDRPDEFSPLREFQLPIFKRHVLLAVASAKTHGKNLDNSMAQLNDHDLEMLWSYMEKHRKDNGEAKTSETMTVEEFVDDDLNTSNNVDNIDETTSVLSYGDDEVGGDGDSDIEMESSAEDSLRLKVARKAPSNDLEDIEETHDDTEELRSSAVKIFPSDQITDLPAVSLGDSLSEKYVPSIKHAQEIGIAEALAKFWEIDEVGSMTTQLSVDGPFSPLSPRKNPKLERKNSYKDRGKRIDERNEALLGLQRQKVISFTQNAQLEREVEALQRQLERIEQLEKSMETQMLSPSNRSILNHSMQSTSSTVVDSESKRGRDHTAISMDRNWNPKFPYIYPIDEEVNEWSGPVTQLSNNSHIPVIKRLAKQTPTKKLVSSSSDDDHEVSSANHRNLRYFSRKENAIIENSENKIENSNVASSTNLNHVKSVRQAAVRRRQKAGFSSGADSDDSNHNFANSINNGKFKKDVNQAGHLSDSESNTYQSPRSNGIRGGSNKTAVSGKKNENRKARNTISNVDDAKPSPLRDLTSDEEKSSSVVPRTKKKGNDRLKQLNGRRHSLDEAPQRDTEISKEGLNGNEIPRSLASGDMLEVPNLLSPSVDGDNSSRNNSNFESRKPARKIIRRKQLEKEIVEDGDTFERLNGKNENQSDVVSNEEERVKVEKSKPVGPRRRRVRSVPIQQESKEEGDEKGNQVWSTDLDYRWTEVSLLLRKPIKSEEDMLYCVAAAEAGIIFTDQMNSIAKSLNVLRGALSRWLLPYDNNTRIDTQCSTPHSVVESMPEEFRGKLTERQVHYLVAGANGVRKLVRIKIADDNDLEQARQALQTINHFFKLIYDHAQKLDLTPFELLLKSNSL